MSDQAGSPDSLDRHRKALGAYADRVDRGAAAIAPGVAELSAADRARALERVDGSLAQLSAAVEGAQLEHAARRVALAGAIGAQGRATQFLEGYGRQFGQERVGQIRDRAMVFYPHVKQQRREWLQEQRVALHDPLLSEEGLRRQLGAEAEASASLASLEVALRGAERNPEKQAEAGRRSGPDRASATVGEDRGELPLVSQMRRFLGSEFEQVEQISSLLEPAAKGRPEQWVMASRRDLRSHLQKPFQESVHQVLQLENERDALASQRAENRAPVDLSGKTKKDLMKIAQDAKLAGRSQMSKGELIAALAARPSPDAGRDADGAGADPDRRIAELRAAWVNEHGARAAFYLTVEGEAHRRQLERGRQPGGRSAPSGQVERPRSATKAAAEPEVAFSVRASFLEARPLLGEERANAIDEATKVARAVAARLDPSDLQSQRAARGDPFQRFDRRGARETAVRELERDRIANALQQSKDLASEAETAAAALTDPRLAKEKDANIDRARVQAALAGRGAERLAAWEAAEAPRRLETTHPDYFVSNHAARGGIALAIEDELRGLGVELPSPRSPEKATSPQRVPEQVVPDIGM